MQVDTSRTFKQSRYAFDVGRFADGAWWFEVYVSTRLPGVVFGAIRETKIII